MTIWLCSIAFAVGLHAPSLVTLLAAAERDSFHTLTTGGQIGLVLISGLLALCTAVVISRLCHKHVWRWAAVESTSTSGLIVKLVAGLTILTILLSFSPQIYYQYYQMIIPGLPTQWVVQPGRTVSMIGEWLIFSGATTYASTFSGVVLWTVIVEVLVRHVSAAVKTRCAFHRTNPSNSQ